MPIGSLGEEVVARLCELLDNAGRGWRKLAELAGAEKRFKCRYGWGALPGAVPERGPQRTWAQLCQGMSEGCPAQLPRPGRGLAEAGTGLCL